MSFFHPNNVRSITDGRWLRRPAGNVDLNGVGIDTRQDLIGRIFIAIRGERFDGHDFLGNAVAAGARLLVVDREVKPIDLPYEIGVLLVENTRHALGRLAHVYRQTLHKTCVIAVAGSAGKTTTKLLIDAALSQVMRGSASPKSFNNDIGVPLTILNAKPDDEYLIVEIGTNALGEVAQLTAIAQPDVAVITMIGREHLEGLGTLDQIAQENAALLHSLRRGGLAVVNADSPLLRQYVNSTQQLILFGEAADANLRLSDRVQGVERGWWFEVNGKARFDISQPGKHNAINALAAVAVARHLGVADELISQGLACAKGAPMRMTIERIGSITIYNDAYNANPDSMIAALHTFAELAAAAPRRIVVLGDMLELGEAGPDLHREIARVLLTIDRRVRIDHAVFVGALAAHAADEVLLAWRNDRLTVREQFDDEGCAEIAGSLRPGDAVLIKGSRGMALERIVAAITLRSEGARNRKRRTRAKIQNPKSKIPA